MRALRRWWGWWYSYPGHHVSFYGVVNPRPGRPNSGMRCECGWEHEHDYVYGFGARQREYRWFRDHLKAAA